MNAPAFPTNRIRRAECLFELIAFDSKESATVVQDHVEAFAKQRLPELMGNVFERFNLPDRVIQLTQIVLDSNVTYGGSLSQLENDLMNHWRAQLENVLTKAISDLKQTTNADIDNNTNPLVLTQRSPNHPTGNTEKSHQSSQDEALFFYLRFGFLRWSHQLAKAQLSQILIDQLNDSVRFQRISTFLRETPQARKRLIRLLNPRDDQRLMKAMGLQDRREILRWWTRIAHDLQKTTFDKNDPFGRVVNGFQSSPSFATDLRGLLLEEMFFKSEINQNSETFIERLVTRLENYLSVPPESVWAWAFQFYDGDSPLPQQYHTIAIRRAQSPTPSPTRLPTTPKTWLARFEKSSQVFAAADRLLQEWVHRPSAMVAWMTSLRKQPTQSKRFFSLLSMAQSRRLAWLIDPSLSLTFEQVLTRGAVGLLKIPESDRDRLRAGWSLIASELTNLHFSDNQILPKREFWIEQTKSKLEKLVQRKKEPTPSAHRVYRLLKRWLQLDSRFASLEVLSQLGEAVSSLNSLNRVTISDDRLVEMIATALSTQLDHLHVSFLQKTFVAHDQRLQKWLDLYRLLVDLPNKGQQIEDIQRSIRKKLSVLIQSSGITTTLPTSERLILLRILRPNSFPNYLGIAEKWLEQVIPNLGLPGATAISNLQWSLIFKFIAQETGDFHPWSFQHWLSKAVTTHIRQTGVLLSKNQRKDQSFLYLPEFKDLASPSQLQLQSSEKSPDLNQEDTQKSTKTFKKQNDAEKQYETMLLKQLEQLWTGEAHRISWRATIDAYSTLIAHSLPSIIIDKLTSQPVQTVLRQELKAGTLGETGLTDLYEWVGGPQSSWLPAYGRRAWKLLTSTLLAKFPYHVRKQRTPDLLVELNLLTLLSCAQSTNPTSFLTQWLTKAMSILETWPDNHLTDWTALRRNRFVAVSISQVERQFPDYLRSFALNPWEDREETETETVWVDQFEQTWQGLQQLMDSGNEPGAYFRFLFQYLVSRFPQALSKRLQHPRQPVLWLRLLDILTSPSKDRLIRLLRPTDGQVLLWLSRWIFKELLEGPEASTLPSTIDYRRQVIEYWVIPKRPFQPLQAIADLIEINIADNHKQSVIERLQRGWLKQKKHLTDSSSLEIATLLTRLRRTIQLTGVSKRLTSTVPSNNLEIIDQETDAFWLEQLIRFRPIDGYQIEKDVRSIIGLPDDTTFLTVPVEKKIRHRRNRLWALLWFFLHPERMQQDGSFDLKAFRKAWQSQEKKNYAENKVRRYVGTEEPTIGKRIELLTIHGESSDAELNVNLIHLTNDLIDKRGTALKDWLQSKVPPPDSRAVNRWVKGIHDEQWNRVMLLMRPEAFVTIQIFSQSLLSGLERWIRSISKISNESQSLLQRAKIITRRLLIKHWLRPNVEFIPATFIDTWCEAQQEMALEIYRKQQLAHASQVNTEVIGTEGDENTESPEVEFVALESQKSRVSFLKHGLANFEQIETSKDTKAVRGLASPERMWPLVRTLLKGKSLNTKEHWEQWLQNTVSPAEITSSDVKIGEVDSTKNEMTDLPVQLDRWLDLSPPAMLSTLQTHLTSTKTSETFFETLDEDRFRAALIKLRPKDYLPLLTFVSASADLVLVEGPPRGIKDSIESAQQIVRHLIISEWVLPEKSFSFPESVTEVLQSLLKQPNRIVSPSQKTKETQTMPLRFIKQRLLTSIDRKLREHNRVNRESVPTDTTMPLLKSYLDDPEPMLQALKKVCLESEGSSVRTSKAGPSSNEDVCLIPEGDPVEIENAGLVLLSPYFDRLFQAFEWVESGKFVSDSAANQASLLLEFLVRGEEPVEEYDLTLNKIFCGIEMTTPLNLPVVFEEKVRQTAEGLLESVITHWKALGNTTVEGFRVSFLTRRGWLTQSDNQWELKVEEKPYDMLIDQIPWSFKLVKQPWMTHSLVTRWRD